MAGRNISHGRGGAGNIYSAKDTREVITTPKDLITPTIKQDVFTTGRGGSGNMMVNDPQRPELARESQDVEAPPQRVEQGPHHTGRGGAANAYIPSTKEEEKAREQAEEEVRKLRAATKERVKEFEEAEKRSQSTSS